MVASRCFALPQDGQQRSAQSCVSFKCSIMIGHAQRITTVSTEPDNLVLQILRDMRATMATKDDLAKMASKDDLRFEINALRADVASDLITTRRGVERADRRPAPRCGRLSHVRHRHGIIISELEARVRRIEQRLDLQAEPH